MHLFITVVPEYGVFDENALGASFIETGILNQHNLPKFFVKN